MVPMRLLCATGGVMWEGDSTLTAPVYQVQVTQFGPGNSNTLFASAYPSGVFKSIDGGGTSAGEQLSLAHHPGRRSRPPGLLRLCHCPVTTRGDLSRRYSAAAFTGIQKVARKRSQLKNGSGSPNMADATVSAFFVSQTDAGTSVAER